MKQKLKNFAYIDGANLHQGVKSLGWDLDYKKFRIWLTEKYAVSEAYLFIGLIAKNKDLYNYLQQAGFTLVFKDTIFDGDGKVKGNCDADLVLWAVRDAYEQSVRSIIVSSDGDYAGLVKFLIDKGKLTAVIAPNNSNKCSILLKRTHAPISYLSDQRGHLQLISGVK